MNTEKVIKALREALGELEKEPTITYKIGQRFKRIGGMFDGQEYLLSRTNSEMLVGLINIQSGEIWSNPVEVCDLYEITQKEMDNLTGCFQFKLIS